MNHPAAIAFERIDDIAVLRLTGHHNLAIGIERIRQGIAEAQAQRIPKLIVVIVEATGYDVPSLSMRASMMRTWAESAAGFVRVAMVCRPEFIDPQRFGITMAANFGMTANVFDNEDEGLAWLRQLA